MWTYIILPQVGEVVLRLMPYYTDISKYCFTVFITASLSWTISSHGRNDFVLGVICSVFDTEVKNIFIFCVCVCVCVCTP